VITAINDARAGLASFTRARMDSSSSSGPAGHGAHSGITAQVHERAAANGPSTDARSKQITHIERITPTP